MAQVVTVVNLGHSIACPCLPLSLQLTEPGGESLERVEQPCCPPALELSLGVFGVPLSAGLWREERWKALSHPLIPRSSLMFMERPLLSSIGVTALTFAGHCKNQKDWHLLN